ncbi:AAA family ATPase [Spirillospora sp. NPDC029432]|uniref:ATP-binding protein n=1 Tax=Spirillospora sp. NPDC029432 TaxID=3154599 RepID=UPI003455CFCC
MGRSAEREPLDRLVEDVRAGESRALVLHGAAGTGKTALLEYAAGRASGCRVVRVSGVQSEMELAFAGLHQLCAPMTGHLDGIPVPQRDALRTAFGLREGPAPDLFLIGLAVLSLLSDMADERPLLCLVDDQQWLDGASAQVLAFVARRLGAESVGMVFAARALGDGLAGLAELAVGGLRVEDARALLESALSGPLDVRVRDQIIAEARGNPLALLELPRGLTAAELAGGFGLPGALRSAGDVEQIFRHRIDALPAESRRLLLLAAADPTGDPVLVARAAERLGVGGDAGAPVAEADLAEFGTRVRFRHPLVRSVAYWSRPAAQRQAAHGALAEVTDPERDGDRRAWHRAQAATGPDEEVAGELEHSAARARARGGLAAAAAFLERAAALTPDPVRRSGRALDAALAKFQAGAFEAAQQLLTVAEAGPLEEYALARVDLLRAHLTFVTSRGGDAPLLLVRAAGRLAPADPGLARETYLDALSATMFAGHLASPGGGALDVARAASTAPRPMDLPNSADHLLSGLAANFTDGYAAGVPPLRQALASFGEGMSADEELRRLWLITEAALHLWDDERWEALSVRYVHLARTAGALSELPLALSTRAYMLLFTGDLATATSLTGEGRAVAEATGGNIAPYSAMALAAFRGSRAEALALVESTGRDVTRRGEGIGAAVATWAKAVLHNGLGEYPEAMAAARTALDHQQYPSMRYPGVANWAAAEFIEAAVRSGENGAAADVCRWLTEMTGASGTGWAVGVEARSQALLAEGGAAEDLYRKALAHLGRTRVGTELARTHLLYGEWLRRLRRRGEARDQLRTAANMLETMGLEGFAERARRELLATGETARRRTVPATGELTAQEAQIARLARDGLSNPEIASRLFISARTVQYHLGKVFAKLGITSRTQLDRALP